MPSIDDLPDETLLEILGNLSQHDKASVARICKKVSHAALTVLYEKPDISLYPEDLDKSSWFLIKTFEFLRTVATVPRLARMVRELGTRLPLFTMRHSKFFEGDQELLAAALCHPQASEILHPSEIDKADFSTDLPLAVLLFRCRALQSISIGAAHLLDRDPGHAQVEIAGFESTAIFRAMRIAAQSSAFSGAQPFFRNLKSLTLDGGNRPSDLPVVLEVVLALPVLEVLHLGGFIERENAESWTCELELSPIKLLTFHICKMSSSTLNKTILSCKTLRLFHFTRVCRGCRPGLGTIDLANLYSALREHSITLEALVLQTEHKCGHPIVYEDQPFQTLAGLHALSLLRIAGHTLFATGEFDELVHLLPARLDQLALDLADTRTRVSDLYQTARLCLRYTETTFWAETHTDIERSQVVLLRKRYPTVTCLRYPKEGLILLESKSRIPVPLMKEPRFGMKWKY